MPASIGYAVPDVATLKAIDENTRTSGYIRSVTSLRAWFIFIAGASDTPDNVNIIQPNVGTGRWFRANTFTANGITDFNESVDDRVASLLTSSSTINYNYNDAANTLTINLINGSVTDTHISNSADINISKIANLQTILDGKTNTGHTHTTADISDFAESLQDNIASFLIAGTNISLNYNDAANTLTINSTGGGGGGNFTWDDITDAEWDGLY